MSIPSTTANASTTGVTTQTPSQNTTGTSPTTSSNGIASTPNSLSAPAQAQSFYDSCSAWISKVLTSVRDCLATLPWIGSIFKAGSTTVPTDSSVVADAENAKAVYDVLLKLNGENAPSTEEIATAVDKFKAISNGSVMADVFVAVFSEENMTQEIFVKFYEALPEDLKNKLKGHIYQANNSSSVLDDHDHNTGFSDHMAYEKFDHQIMKDAIANWHAELCPQV